MYDRHNNLVFSFASEDRTNVSLDEISPAMIAAVLSAEDRSFFRHAGMDIFGLARAAWVDLKARAVKQGGSTITQQLVRTVALTKDRKLGRKVKELMLALRVERRYAKKQILAAYLNRIYLGEGHYGVEAAARGYFGKPASRLTVAESATLAGLIPLPLDLLSATGTGGVCYPPEFGVARDAHDTRHYTRRVRQLEPSSALGHR